MCFVRARLADIWVGGGVDSVLIGKSDTLGLPYPRGRVELSMGSGLLSGVCIWVVGVGVTVSCISLHR